MTMISSILAVLLYCIFVVEGLLSFSFVTKRQSIDVWTTTATLFQSLQPEPTREDELPVVSFVDETNSKNTAEERHIPIGGISVSDEMAAQQQQQDPFVTRVVAIPGLTGVAQLITNPIYHDAFEPIRYLVALDPPSSTIIEEQDSPIEQISNAFPNTQTFNQDTKQQSLDKKPIFFALIDVPPFSDALVKQIQAFMGDTNELVAILITSSDAIHYDEVPTQMYAISRRGELLKQWKRAFPRASIISCRIDTPRDCRDIVTQRLDGNGPFGWDHNSRAFVEMARPLRLEPWDTVTAENVFSGKTSPEDVLTTAVVANQSSVVIDEKHLDPFSLDAVRAREEGRKILAICTPGHSFGSLSFVFLNMGICCSGYTIPVEDRDNGELAPALDVRGYLTTSRAGITRQMQSAKFLVEHYIDRFYHVLPSQGQPLLMDPKSQSQERLEFLLSLLDQYNRIGQIYEQLGITSSNDNNDNLSP